MLVIDHVPDEVGKKTTQSYDNTSNALKSKQNTTSLAPPVESHIEPILFSNCESLEQHLQIDPSNAIEVQNNHTLMQKKVDHVNTLDNEFHVHTTEGAMALTCTTICSKSKDTSDYNNNGSNLTEDNFISDSEQSQVNENIRIHNMCTPPPSSSKIAPCVPPLFTENTANTSSLVPHDPIQPPFRQKRSGSFHRPIFLPAIKPNNSHPESQASNHDQSKNSIAVCIAQQNRNPNSYISHIGAVEAAIHYLPSEEKLQIREAVKKRISDSNINSLKCNNHYYSDSELADENIPPCPFRITPTNYTIETHYLEHIKRVFLYYANSKIYSCSDSDEDIYDKYFISAHGLLLLVKHSLLQLREDCESRLTKRYPNSDLSEIQTKTDIFFNKLVPGKTKNEKIMKAVLAFLAKLYNVEPSNLNNVNSEHIHFPIHIRFSQFLDYSKRSFSMRAKNC